jgi:hypothetical protein
MLSSAYFASKSVVSRSWKTCAAWLMAISISIGLIVFSEIGLRWETRAVISLVALFCFQAFLAEFIGIRASEKEISFPRRMLPRLGFPVLWRRSFAARNLSRVDSLDERTTRLYLKSCDQVDLLFARGEDRRRFVHFLEKYLRERSLARNSHSLSSRDSAATRT